MSSSARKENKGNIVTIWWLFTISYKCSWKLNGIRLFTSFQLKISGSNSTSEKFCFALRNIPNGSSCCVPLKANLDTSFKPSRPFYGKRNWFLQMLKAILGRNLVVLNLSYHLYPNRYPTGLPVMGNQPTSHACLPSRHSALRLESHSSAV